jgi:hypothetical protein
MASLHQGSKQMPHFSVRLLGCVSNEGATQGVIHLSNERQPLLSFPLSIVLRPAKVPDEKGTPMIFQGQNATANDGSETAVVPARIAADT